MVVISALCVRHSFASGMSPSIMHSLIGLRGDTMWWTSGRPDFPESLQKDPDVTSCKGQNLQGSPTKLSFDDQLAQLQSIYDQYAHNLKVAPSKSPTLPLRKINK